MRERERERERERTATRACTHTHTLVHFLFFRNGFKCAFDSDARVKWQEEQGCSFALHFLMSSATTRQNHDEIASYQCDLCDPSATQI